ncbi:succinyl-diaminopimelate desuccinylase [Micropruina glycogenica]|uniref:Succinyl-diaminopimelate desuccinylase n=1 Tax=Micropruina glycogenica TaxID=75385 RepID=A0A2N9JJG4_9ACTN|nr:succinyl-diaminopimelate desuccinylase [Micropruina glycogenica]SPD87569.1 Succinyl-diaminopimelate desuccinylase [Micropruina glycogenica]
MSLDPHGDLVVLLRALVDVESVSGNETALADQVESALQGHEHLEVLRDGDTVIARTHLGRPERVVIAGHLDTVPVAGNLPTSLAGDRVYGRGTCDMKGGVAVMLAVAVAATTPPRDLTWIFYDHEEVEASANSLTRIASERPDLLVGDFAVLMEPTSAKVEGGCQGTLRFTVTTKGKAAHSARAWMGHNAIHDLAEVLAVLRDHEPEQPVVDGLRYHEGLNAVAVTGGIAGNVIPDTATVSVNYRFAPHRSLADAEHYCRSLLPDHDLTFTDGAAGARPGLDVPAAATFVDAVGGEPSAKFGWTDVARFSALGVPAVNFGPGDPSKAHADDEFCPIDELYTCRDALLRWLDRPA